MSFAFKITYRLGTKRCEFTRLRPFWGLSSSPPYSLQHRSLLLPYRRSHAHKMALRPAEKEQFGIEIMEEMSQTPYACSSLTLLSGGTANFLFRGVLTQPLLNGTSTIVVKHSKDFVSANRNFQLDISRCVGYPFFPFPNFRYYASSGILSKNMLILNNT